MVEVQGVLEGFHSWKLVQLASQYGDVNVSYSLLGASARKHSQNGTS